MWPALTGYWADWVGRVSQTNTSVYGEKVDNQTVNISHYGEYIPFPSVLANHYLAACLRLWLVEQSTITGRPSPSFSLRLNAVCLSKIRGERETWNTRLADIHWRALAHVVNLHSATMCCRHLFQNAIWKQNSLSKAVVKLGQAWPPHGCVTVSC